VPLDVGLERGGPYESRATEATLKGSLPRVRAQVIVQETKRSEGHAANLTFERFDTAVNPHMDFHVAALSETFLANGTLEGLDACVRADMDL